MPKPDRLSALDLAFLALDSDVAPLHVGWTMRFGGDPPSLAALRRHVTARLGAIPRFRRRVVAPALGLGDARWADDPGFDVANHVGAVSLPAPGGTSELRELAGLLLSSPLDPARPLWRLHLVGGLGGAEGRGFALVGQAHHALVDGIAAMEVALLLFGPEAPAEQATFFPQRTAGVGTGLRHALADRAHLASGLAAGARGLRPAAVRDATGALEALRSPTPPTSLDATTGPERSVAFAQVGLDGVRTAGRRHGATVNDVLLAASTLALGRALKRRGETPGDCKVLVPVSVRAAGTAGALGNRISLITVSLPTGETDAVSVLRTVRDRTRAGKTAGAAQPLDTLARAADVLPGGAQRVVAAATMQVASYTAVVSNVPGPPVTLSLLGRPLEALLPSVPLPAGHGLTIGAISYADRLHVGLTADAGTVGDIVDIGRDLEAAFDVLRVEAPLAPTPWRARAVRQRTSRARKTPLPA